MARHRFTERWVAARRAPADQRLEYVDAACPGLWLRVSGRDARVFSVLARVGGRLRRRTLGRHPRWSVADARAEANRVLRMVDAGLDPFAADSAPAPQQPPQPPQPSDRGLAPTRSADMPGRPQQPQQPSPAMPAAMVHAPAEPTFAQALEDYVRLHLVPNTRSAAAIARNLRHPALAGFQARPIGGITRAEIVAVLDGMVAAGMPQAALNTLRRLNMFMGWAADRDIVAANPCARVRPPAKAVERDRVLTDAETRAIWLAADQLGDPMGAFYRMLFLTGARRTELAQMRWREIDGAVWVIPRERVKKDRPHSVPLVPTALAALAALPRHGPDAFVFTTTGGARPFSGFSKTKALLDRLSGTAGWTNHDIRRTVRSKLAELGVPREVARKLLNHEDGKVDRIYNRYAYAAEKRAALERLEAGLLGLAGA